MTHDSPAYDDNRRYDSAGNEEKDGRGSNILPWQSDALTAVDAALLSIHMDDPRTQLERAASWIAGAISAFEESVASSDSAEAS